VKTDAKRIFLELHHNSNGEMSVGEQETPAIQQKARILLDFFFAIL
jgi:hypothetical protein